ncbi:hypothetical protein PMIT1327_00140 [Prochlorococcus marinus str. MIT 1327]|nr:hypothetical protein PMIT1312_00320 [Prochlorococcus marinus str. MIT 1312]KZR84226.1 hypothetical protein PMIT1327_00140 [Prochlorococcus marinus str. MIT 1327]
MFGLSAPAGDTAVWCDFWCENCFGAEWVSLVGFGSNALRGALKV